MCFVLDCTVIRTGERKVTFVSFKYLCSTIYIPQLKKGIFQESKTLYTINSPKVMEFVQKHELDVYVYHGNLVY